MCTLVNTSAPVVYANGNNANNLAVSQCSIPSPKEDSQEDLTNFLITVQNLLCKYKMYSKSQSSMPVASGGLQQLITQKVRKQSESHISSFSFMKRLRAFYGQSECVSQLPLDEEDGPNLLRFLPVSMNAS